MNRIVAILTIVTIALGFASCTKYENGPSVSLKSPKSRAVGEWHITDLLVNDKHEQALFDKESSAVLTLEKDGTYTHIPVFNKAKVFDVTGAGDTVTALYSMALASGAEPVYAAIIGNIAASIVIKQFGCATTTIEEILAAIPEKIELEN